MDFSQSSQAKYWLFSPTALYTRKEARQNKWSRISNIEKLTVEDEDVLINVFIDYYKEANSRWNFSPRVWLVAITYFRRFFLDRSVMDYDVKQCMNTCVVIASKVEEERRNNNRTIEFMQKESNGFDIESIIILEYIILDAMNFQLEIFSPLLQLTGFLVDIQSKLNDLLNIETLQRINSKAEQLLLKAITTEVNHYRDIIIL
jgi:cyclin H